MRVPSRDKGRRDSEVKRSLRFFGLEAESAAFFRDVVAAAKGSGLSATTIRFWRRAVEGGLWDTMRGMPSFN